MTSATASGSASQPAGLVLWGAGGHARVLRDAVAPMPVLAVFDREERPPPWQGVAFHRGRQGFLAWLSGWSGPLPGFAIAIGGGRGSDRLGLAAWLAGHGLAPLTLRHPTALVERSAHLGEGAQVLLGATVAAEARLGAQTIVNTRASVDHDCRIGAGCHIGPGAVLCGEITLGDRVFVGAGAVVLPKLTVGADATIGAGAVVTEHVPEGATVVGVPARQVAP